MFLEWYLMLGLVEFPPWPDKTLPPATGIPQDHHPNSKKTWSQQQKPLVVYGCIACIACHISMLPPLIPGTQFFQSWWPPTTASASKCVRLISAFIRSLQEVLRFWIEFEPIGWGSKTTKHNWGSTTLQELQGKCKLIWMNFEMIHPKYSNFEIGAPQATTIRLSTSWWHAWSPSIILEPRIFLLKGKSLVSWWWISIKTMPVPFTQLKQTGGDMSKIHMWHYRWLRDIGQFANTPCS